MSLVSVAEAQARGIGTGLGDSTLQAVIDAAEAYLARAIGPLEGERTENLYPRRGSEPLYLRRHTASVTIEDNAEAVDAADFRFHQGFILDRFETSWVGDLVEVTYTPDDETEVHEAVLDLLRLNLADSPYISERIGEYMYQKAQRAGSFDMARIAIIRRLLPDYPFRSERIVSSVRS